MISKTFLLIPIEGKTGGIKRIQLTAGPLPHQAGTVVAVRNKTVKVIIPSLGYILVATVEKKHIEVVAPTNSKRLEMEKA